MGPETPWAMTRATKSALPPIPGVTRRMGLFGKGWAGAPLAPPIIRPTAHIPAIRRDISKKASRMKTIVRPSSCADSQPVQSPENGAVVEFQDVGGLHGNYERMAA